MQPEERAAVEDQVELYIASATVQLELPLSLSPGLRHALAHEGHISLGEGVPDGALEGEGGIEVPAVQVVEEQPADPAGLAAVFKEEVLVTPFLVGRVDVLAKGRAGLLSGTVPMTAVFLIGVIRSEVVATAEPPDRFGPFALGHEEPHVHVRGGHIGVSRVDHEGHTQRRKTPAGQLRTMRGGGGRQGGPTHARVVHARFLENGPVGQHTRDATTAFGSGPPVLGESRLPVGRGDCVADVVLQAQQVTFDSIDIGFGGSHDPGSSWGESGAMIAGLAARMMRPLKASRISLGPRSPPSSPGSSPSSRSRK